MTDLILLIAVTGSTLVGALVLYPERIDWSRDEPAPGPARRTTPGRRQD